MKVKSFQSQYEFIENSSIISNFVEQILSKGREKISESGFQKHYFF